MHARHHGSVAQFNLLLQEQLYGAGLLLTPPMTLAAVPMQTSLGGLRQEVDAVKQLGNSRSNSSPQQQISYPGELLDPLHGFSARLSTPVRRSALAASEASGMAGAAYSTQCIQQHASLD